MEMSQAERKQYKTVQFEDTDIEEIIKFAKQLEKSLGIRFSQRMAIMYAIRQLKDKPKKS